MITKVEDFYGMQLNDLYGVLQKLVEEIAYAKGTAETAFKNGYYETYESWNMHALRMERLLEELE
jgi:hypothetical protein